ncbi:syntaxin-5-like [Halichondria panicea]|uniref:syntaxin-5-like n=1 Tax=Halichondria panicea TaxID=6063 RepID=UPI00312B3ACE
MTTGRDRTAEFSSVVSSLQSYQSPNKTVRQRSLKPSEVMRAAKRIGYDISCTCTKLEKLTELARGRSLFGDPTSEIQELTQVIKQDLSKLNSDIADLQQRVKSQSYGETKHMRSHSSSVVVSLQSKLVDLSKDFKGVLEVRTENLKQQKQRREQFSSATVSTSLTSSPALGGGSVLMQSDRNGSVSIDMDSLSKDQHNQMQLLEQQDTYIQERAEAMDNIHSTIVELGSIFRQLAEMVKEQEEQVVRIDANVSETQTNVEAAHTELLKYFQGITSNRWLMMKVFAVVIVFFIIFIVFVA